VLVYSCSYISDCQINIQYVPVATETGLVCHANYQQKLVPETG